MKRAVPEANPRVLAQDFLATLVVWDAATSGALSRRELFGARELFASFDPESRRADVLRGLMDFAKARVATLPLSVADADAVKRVFGALPFGPMDDVPRQMLFVLWLWSRFEREREVVRVSLHAARGAMLAEVKRLTELSRPLAEKMAHLAVEGLTVDAALEKFLAFVSQPSGHPPAWGVAVARGLAHAILDGLPGVDAAISPTELVAAVWVSFRIDARNFAELVEEFAA